MLYFAYAANLNHIHMARLCPGAEPLYPAILENHTLTVRRWFTAEPEEGRAVMGGVWKIEPGLLPRLDSYEDYPGLYERKVVTVNLAERGSKGAWAHGGKNSVGVSEYRRIGEKAQAYPAVNKRIECIVYLMREPFQIPPSPPDPQYLEMVREGYREWAIPFDQVERALHSLP